jgi:ribosomal protein L12E/L44/L45/RPP1/RPP2
MATNTCPPFGAGSVDFAKVHAAALKGDDLKKAIAAATTAPSAPPAAPPVATSVTKPAKGKH